MSDIDQLIQQGERLIVEQKSSEAEGIARIIDSANLQRDWRLQHLNEDVSGDIIFENLSQQIDTKYSNILNTLAGLTKQLKDIKNARASVASPCDFFWSIWSFWNEDLFWQPNQKDFNGVWVITGRNMGTHVIRLPEGFETWTLDSLAYLEKEHQVLNEPDEYKPTEILAYTYYAAAYGLILFEQENSYSEESIRAFQESFRAYFSVYKSVGEGEDLASLEDWYPLLDTEVQVTVGFHLFKIRVLQGDWQDALRMYAHAMACFSYAAITAIEIDSPTPTTEFWNRAEEGLHEEAQCVFNHIRELPQPPGDVLWIEIAEHVDLIIKSIKRYWGDDDAKLLSYWTGARWWLRGAKLEPGQIRDELRKEEDAKAEQRLRRYFFDDYQWGALPEQSRRSLVEADRVWFSSQRGNPGATLESTKIATEALLYEMFWKPCFEWIDAGNLGSPKAKGLLSRKRTLEKRMRVPALEDFNYMLKSEGFLAYRKTLPISDEMEFFDALPRHLRSLAKKRKQVAHPLESPVLTRDQVGPLYKKFLGLGEEGILPRLARIKSRLDKRKSFPAQLV